MLDSNEECSGWKSAERFKQPSRRQRGRWVGTPGGWLTSTWLPSSPSNLRQLFELRVFQQTSRLPASIHLCISTVPSTVPGPQQVPRNYLLKELINDVNGTRHVTKYGDPRVAHTTKLCPAREQSLNDGSARALTALGTGGGPCSSCLQEQAIWRRKHMADVFNF